MLIGVYPTNWIMLVPNLDCMCLKLIIFYTKLYKPADTPE